MNGSSSRDDCLSNGFGRHHLLMRRYSLASEEAKRRERAQAIGLFRYQLICPALDPGLSTKARGQLVRQIAAVSTPIHSAPGCAIRATPSTAGSAATGPAGSMS